MPAHVGQAEVAALVAEDEFLVVEAEAVEHGGLEVVDWTGSFTMSQPHSSVPPWATPPRKPPSWFYSSCGEASLRTGEQPEEAAQRPPLTAAACTDILTMDFESMQESPIERSDQVLGGTVVFTGTRVPVQTLMDYLEAGERLDDFLADFPTVTREQAIAALELASKALRLDARAS